MDYTMQSSLRQSNYQFIWQTFFKNIRIVWKCKLIVCSLMVSSDCITTNYHTKFHSNTRFNPKATLVKMLKIHEKQYHTLFEVTTI